MSTCQKPSPPVENANCEHVSQDPQTANLQICTMIIMGNDDDDVGLVGAPLLRSPIASPNIVGRSETTLPPPLPLPLLPPQ